MLVPHCFLDHFTLSHWLGLVDIRNGLIRLISKNRFNHNQTRSEINVTSLQLDLSAC